MFNLKTGFSHWILLRMLVLGVLAAGVIAWNYDFIRDLYLRNQATPTGLIINSAIFVLFLLGLAKIIATLLRYAWEENQIARFVRRVDHEGADPTIGVSRKSLIHSRFRTLLELGRLHAPINQSALAAVLVAEESTRLSFARFVNNILILTGVFGTIVSLSIALLGASNLLHGTDEIANVANMDMVIHGMSTALSTTITAILCYLFFGYFYFKVSDAQTRLLSQIEDVTTRHLMPRFAQDQDGLVAQVASLVKGLRKTATAMHAAQQDYAEAGTRLNHMVFSLEQRIDALSDEIARIRGTLREGFRLSAAED